MTALQPNAIYTQIWQNIGQIADSEPLMRRLSNYTAKLVKAKNDPTAMTKEQFEAKIERAEAAYARGEGDEMLPGEDLTAFLKRMGYDL